MNLANFLPSIAQLYDLEEVPRDSYHRDPTHSPTYTFVIRSRRYHNHYRHRQHHHFHHQATHVWYLKLLLLLNLHHQLNERFDVCMRKKPCLF